MDDMDDRTGALPPRDRTGRTTGRVLPSHRLLRPLMQLALLLTTVGCGQPGTAPLPLAPPSFSQRPAALVSAELRRWGDSLLAHPAVPNPATVTGVLLLAADVVAATGEVGQLVLERGAQGEQAAQLDTMEAVAVHAYFSPTACAAVAASAQPGTEMRGCGDGVTVLAWRLEPAGWRILLLAVPTGATVLGQLSDDDHLAWSYLVRAPSPSVGYVAQGSTVRLREATTPGTCGMLRFAIYKNGGACTITRVAVESALVFADEATLGSPSGPTRVVVRIGAQTLPGAYVAIDPATVGRDY